MKKVLITGADRGIGLALCREFMENGWQVFAARFMKNWAELDTLKEEYGERLSLINLDVGNEASVKQAVNTVKEQTDCLDMLINCAGIFQNGSNATTFRCLNVNAMGPLRMVESFLPLMENGEKKLCFFSSEAGSITLAHRKGELSYCVSKTCLNMAVRLMFEKLQPKGYSFRLYHPGWVRTYMEGEKKSTVGNLEPEETAAVAYRQFVSETAYEDVLVMRDVLDEMWSF